MWSLISIHPDHIIRTSLRTSNSRIPASIRALRLRIRALSLQIRALHLRIHALSIQIRALHLRIRALRLQIHAPSPQTRVLHPKVSRPTTPPHPISNNQQLTYIHSSPIPLLSLYNHSLQVMLPSKVLIFLLLYFF